MIQADTFVGSLAIFLAIAVGTTAIRPSGKLPVLGAATWIRERFGDTAGRWFLALLASLLLILGVMILRDFRPAFAAPLTGTSQDRTAD